MKFRPSFSIRDILWLTVVAALAFGWWHDRRRNVNKYEAWCEDVVNQCNASLEGMSARVANAEQELETLRAESRQEFVDAQTPEWRATSNSRLPDE